MAEVEARGFISTRRGSEEVSFETALLRGLAPDGGLYVPRSVPSVPEPAWREASDIASIGSRVLGRWIGDQVPQNTIDAVIGDALDFPVPLVRLEGGEWGDTYVLELFHGPTLSFKDFGARTMARFMAHFLAARSEEVTILVATSGDTGSAVADGFAGQRGVEVALLYPFGQVSPVQERQLIVRRPGVHAFAVQGTFDDCQRIVKEAFAHPEFADMLLSSANSINVGRLLPQMLYYFEAFRAGSFDDAVVCVPSGNLGNLTAGVMAGLSGLPVRRFVAAHNANDFFPSHLVSGATEYRPSVRTISSAMDVGVPSNFERIRHLLPDGWLRRNVVGTSVSDEVTRTTIRTVLDQTGYLADPHTAVGLEAIRRCREQGERGPFIVLSTAHPAKFPEIVEPIIGSAVEMPKALSGLWEMEVRVTEIAPDVSALAAAMRSATRA